MALLKRLTKEQIAKDYSHYGLMFGVVPVYVGNPMSESPTICVRNWWPEWLFDIAAGLFSVAVQMRTSVDPLYEPMFPIRLQGKIRG